VKLRDAAAFALMSFVFASCTDAGFEYPALSVFRPEMMASHQQYLDALRQRCESGDSFACQQAQRCPHEILFEGDQIPSDSEVQACGTACQQGDELACEDWKRLLCKKGGHWPCL
jgi:hypothetical protein